MTYTFKNTLDNLSMHLLLSISILSMKTTTVYFSISYLPQITKLKYHYHVIK